SQDTSRRPTASEGIVHSSWDRNNDDWRAAVTAETHDIPARSTRPASVAQTAPGPASADARVSTILVVDDEPLARQMFSDLLEAQGFRVVTVARGEEAFGFLNEVDLVLLDAM